MALGSQEVAQLEGLAGVGVALLEEFVAMGTGFEVSSTQATPNVIQSPAAACMQIKM